MYKTLLISICLAHLALALPDTANAAFYWQLEQQLRLDYFDCTGDTAKLPVKSLIRWKHWNDSMTALPGYPKIAKAYKAETGKSAVSDRPCAVVKWKLAKDSVLAVAADEKKRLVARQKTVKAESLAVHKEIVSLKGLPFAFAGIPLGASKQAFTWMAKRAGFEEIVDNGSYTIVKRVPFGDRFWLGAFYFDTLGLCRYELEGVERPADSLDDVVRSEAHYLASLFEERIGSRPHQTNRVNRDDIVQDELAIVKAWSQSAWSVAIGLSRHNFRYYAKAVATNRPLPVK